MPVLETEKYKFRYVRTAAGTLPGRDFILQTEAAITELGNTALESTEEALSNSQQALTNSENALNIANSAQSDASLALTVAYDARERAVNANDAASQAQKTADQAVSDAAAAQTAADKAQSTADYAQELAESGLELAREANTKAENAQTTADTALETANTALENANDAANAATAAQNTADEALAKAEAAQETADSAQETADSAQSLADTNSDLISSLGTELTNVQSSLEEQINAMGFWFELDESTTSLELWGTVLAKKYLTQSISDGPAGTSPPYWFWNFVRQDGKGCVQWLRTSDGTIYSREGTNTSYQINDGTDEFNLVAFSDAEATVSLAGSSADNTLTWTVSGGGSIESQSQGMLTASCTIVMQLSAIPEEGDITLNGVILGTLTNEGVVRDMDLTSDHCNVSLDSAEIDEAASTVTITLLANWTDYVSGDTTWSDWATLSGGSGGNISVSERYVVLTGDYASGDRITTQGLTYGVGTNRLQVFYEGVKLILGENYNEVDSTTIELLFDAEAGATLEFIYLGTGGGSDDGGGTGSGYPGVEAQPGMMMMLMTQTVPEGWLLCNGAAVSRTDYIDLYSAIGTLYGSGDGSTTFNLPDCRDVFIEGAGTNSLGVGVSQGLPYFRGRIGFRKQTGEVNGGSYTSIVGVSGCFTEIESDQEITAAPILRETSLTRDLVSFEGSAYSSIYSDSKVQPPALVGHYIIKC